jgi:hypothetical protein
MTANTVRHPPLAPPGLQSFTAALLRRCPALLFLFALPSHAQLFSFGVIGGVPITSAYTCITCYDRRYIIGPTAEVRLPFHLSIEVDALYRRNGFIIPGFRGSQTLSAPVDDWQVPLLAKYEIKAGVLRPFVDGGVVYRHAGVASSSANLLSLDHPNSAGIAVGGGLTVKLGILRLSPQVRYTHWPNPPLTIYELPYVFSTRNQADVLVGFTF